MTVAPEARGLGDLRQHRRVSTATRGENLFLAKLVEPMPAGLILNLGAGNTGVEDGAHAVVNVDHVRPLGSRPPGMFVVADARRLPFATGTFSGAVAKDVLEHVDDPIGVLGELRRSCRTSAALVVVVPRAIPRAVWDDPTHIRGFTKRALRTAFDLSGWTLCSSVRRVGGFPGAGRLGFTGHLEMLMRVPGFGHWFGTNWIARATSAQ